MLKRFPCAAIANEVPERSALGIGKRTIKFKVKVQTPLAKNMREKMLGVESRTLDSAMLEIAGGSGQNLKDGHGMG